jgi:hypothetical protein
MRGFDKKSSQLLSTTLLLYSTTTLLCYPTLLYYFSTLALLWLKDWAQLLQGAFAPELAMTPHPVESWQEK